MSVAFLEHANITVSSPSKTAEMLSSIFDWAVRWQGPGKDGGVTYHVGRKDHYLALYSNGGNDDVGNTYSALGGLNHIGIVVDDLDEIERRVKTYGFTTHNHGDYEPGRRFYFEDSDGIEIEVVSYAA